MTSFYTALYAMVQAKHSGATGTVVAANPEIYAVGTKFLVDATGCELLGQIDGGLYNKIRNSVLEVMNRKSSKTVEVEWQGAALKVFIDPIYPEARLIIMGGGHIALPLVSIGKMLNYEVIVLDDRIDFANSARFPQAAQVICRDFETGIREVSFDANTYVVIVTRGHRHDKTCLSLVLTQGIPAYVGMIGSRRKVEALFQELRQTGFSEEELNRVYAPIGLDLGAQSPEEIAVSIMAEIIMVSRYGYSKGLKRKQGE